MQYEDYEKKYSDESFGEKIKNSLKSAGVKVLYYAFILRYVLDVPGVPLRVKTAIVGALGYFIAPIDAIPDITPIIGYTDDLGGLLLALGLASLYITDREKEKAKQQIAALFGEDCIADLD